MMVNSNKKKRRHMNSGMSPMKKLLKQRTRNMAVRLKKNHCNNLGKISPIYLKFLYKSMLRHMKAVVNTQGEYSKY